MAQTQTATGLATRYNIVGAITGLRVFKDDEGKVKNASFKIARAGKRAVSAIAFAEKAEALIGQFNDGDTAKLFGFFKPHTFKATDGQQVTYNRFQLLWSGVPTEKDAPTADQGVADQVPGSESAVTGAAGETSEVKASEGEENPFGEFAG